MAPSETSWLSLVLGVFIWAGAGAFCALLVKWLSWFHDFWLALPAMWRPLAIVLVAPPSCSSPIKDVNGGLA